MTALEGLVAVYPEIVVEPFTSQDIDACAKLAPLDHVSGFLLTHLRCVAGRSDAVELDPPVTDGGPLHGRCRHCGGTEVLETVYPVEDLASVLYYWKVLCSAMVFECPDVFFGHGTETAVARFSDCREAFEETIRRCVLLAQADGVAH